MCPEDTTYDDLNPTPATANPPSEGVSGGSPGAYNENLNPMTIPANPSSGAAAGAYKTIYNATMNSNEKYKFHLDSVQVVTRKWQENFQYILGPTNPAFVDAELSYQDTAYGYRLEYNPNGVLWRVSAAGIPHPDDFDNYLEQRRVIESTTEVVSAQANLPTQYSQTDWRSPLQAIVIRGNSVEQQKANLFGWVRVDANGNPKLHQGVDIVAKVGTPINAVQNGIICEINDDPTSTTGYGSYIILQFEKDGKTYYALYAHLSEIHVYSNQVVEGGQIIGKTGTSGNATGMDGEEQHLHFEIATTSSFSTGIDTRIDPMPFLNVKLNTEMNVQNNEVVSAVPDSVRINDQNSRNLGIASVLSSKLVSSDDLLTKTSKIIFSNEGDYNEVNPNDNGALSIGKIQWNGPRARNLLIAIVGMNPEQAKKILGETTILNELSYDDEFWNWRSLNSSEKIAIETLLSTDESRIAQDMQSRNDVKGYIEHGKSLGITDNRVLAYYADLENQGGEGASARVVRAAGGGDGLTLEKLYKAAISDSVMGNSEYLDRRKKTYNSCLGID